MIQTKIETHEDLVAALKASGKPHDMEKIERAYHLADAAHGGQVRRSGDPYISHPVSVAIILAGMGMDSDCICAALLHDVVEDTDISLDQIRKEFGNDVAVMVSGVTKLTNMPLSTKEEQQAENIRKMLLAMNEDIRVILIKLADRLHNMRTMQFQTPDKQRQKSHETMEIYAPIAHRLGIRSVKDELEDLALRYLDPVAYKEIESRLEMGKKEREEFIASVQKKIRERFSEYGLNPHIEGRVKSIYGIYRKMLCQGQAVRGDLRHLRRPGHRRHHHRVLQRPRPHPRHVHAPSPTGLRTISPPPSPTSTGRCTPRFIDHGTPFEVQIRTWEMHYTAEYGIAAHWKYKAGITGKDQKGDQQLEWVRKIIESQQEAEARGPDAEHPAPTFRPTTSSSSPPRGTSRTSPPGRRSSTSPTPSTPPLATR